MKYESTNTRKNIKIIYPELSYKITGLMFEVHNELGRFCKEKQYADLLELKFKKEKILHEREKEIPFNCSDGQIKGNKIDFIIENKILIDIKAKKFVTKEDFYQMKRYLRASESRLGLIVNFHNTYLKPKRVLN